MDEKGNIVINLGKLKKAGLTVQEYCLAYLIYKKDYDSIALLAEAFEYNNTDKKLAILPVYTLQQKEFIIITDPMKATGFEVRQKFIDIIQDVDITNKVEDVDNWIDTFRSLFKATKKVGAMGDRNACSDKMKRFLKKNPKYTKDQILIAAIKYINSEANNASYRYLQQADYFIYKQENSSKIERSRLLTFLEEMVTSGISGSNITNTSAGIESLLEQADTTEVL